MKPDALEPPFAESAPPAVTFDRCGGARHEFLAWLPEELVTSKFSSFIAAEKCTVREISHRHVRLRYGRRRWFGMRQEPKDFPLDVTVTLDRAAAGDDSMTKVIASVRPLRRNIPRALLRRRCKALMQSLRKSLIAHDVHRTSYFADRWTDSPANGT